MPLTERIEAMVSPELRKRLETRAREEGKSVAGLLREFVEIGLSMSPRAVRLKAVERVATMNLPTCDWEQMEREIEAGRVMNRT